MPTPLQRTETLIRYPFRPPITITEYYAKLESLAPGCDSHELDVQLTAFCMRFKLELSTRGIRSYSNNRSNTVHSTKPMVYKLLDNTNESNSSKSLVPKWMFDPDESHDKLHHLLRFKCHVDIPQDDSVS